MDVQNATHDQVVSLLKGLERFVRICVEREVEVAVSNSSLSKVATPSGTDKSPKVFGLPKPYTGLYSSNSYMANRPSYVRTREPGQYTLNRY